jgi:hypothetical protein
LGAFLFLPAISVMTAFPSLLAISAMSGASYPTVCCRETARCLEVFIISDSYSLHLPRLRLSIDRGRDYSVISFPSTTKESTKIETLSLYFTFVILALGLYFYCGYGSSLI